MATDPTSAKPAKARAVKGSARSGGGRVVEQLLQQVADDAVADTTGAALAPKRTTKAPAKSAPAKSAETKSAPAKSAAKSTPAKSAAPKSPPAKNAEVAATKSPTKSAAKSPATKSPATKSPAAKGAPVGVEPELAQPVEAKSRSRAAKKPAALEVAELSTETVLVAEAVIAEPVVADKPVRTSRTSPASAFYNDRNTELFTDRRSVKQTIDELLRLRDSGELTQDGTYELNRAQQKLDDITSDIVKFNYGLVVSYVKKFTTTSRDDSDDFEGAGRVGLMRAIDTYDLTKGRFGAWAFKPIQREILRAVRDMEYPNMNPGDFEKRPDILSAWRKLQDGNEDARPAYTDVAAEAGTTVEQVMRVLDAPRLDSLSAPVGDDGETELGDLIPDNEDDVEERVLSTMNIAALTDYGLTSLDPRELFVIFRRFGLDAEQEQNLSSIGEMLGLSREAVRQIESKALAKLNHPVVLRRLARHGRR